MPDRLLPVTRNGRIFVGLVLFLALALRFGAVLKTTDGYAPQTDAKHFDIIATSLIHGHGFGHAVLPPATGPTAQRSPLYPISLAGVYAVFGDHSWTAGRLTNEFFGVGIVALIGLIGAQLFGRRIGAIALALAAINPTLILIASGLQLEPLLVLLNLATVALALRYRGRPRGVLLPIALGVTLGLAVLSRELTFFWIPSLVWLIWPAEKSGGFRAKAAVPALVLVLAGAVVAPWTIRNAVRLHAFIPVSIGNGIGLSGTYNATAMAHRGRWSRPYDDPTMRGVLEKLIAEKPRPTEVDVDRVLQSASLKFAREHPVYTAFQVPFWNTIRMFDLDGGAYSRYVTRFLPYPRRLVNPAVYGFYLFALLAIVGAFSAKARAAPKAIWLIPVLLYFALVVPLPGTIRYRASLEPFFTLVAALAVAPAVDRVLAQFRHAENADVSEPQGGAGRRS
ncbi:MAG TPA: glycosyltransferase family 39 protein [Acidimicrobiales bacterium]|nr:glycosyltransferase family 39 protein [Acidimicrobiales bacterium]